MGRKPNKRANGEGSIVRRQDGRWVGQYTAPTRDGTKRIYVYGKTKKEVADKLAQALSEIRKGVIYDETTVQAFLERWLKNSVRNSVSQRTFERYEQMVRLHISPEIGKSKPRDLSPLHFQALYRGKLDEIDRLRSTPSGITKKGLVPL